LPGLRKVVAANGVLLCPLCGAKYEVLVKGEREQCEAIKAHLLAVDPNETEESNLIIPLELDGCAGQLRFVQTHWIDLRAVLNVDGRLRAEDS